MATFRVATMLCLIVVASLISGCGLVSGPKPTDQICDGVPADIGGCNDPPTYVGSTCEALAAEWGRYVDDRVTQIINGPEDVDGARKSARIQQFLVLATVRMSLYMNRIGLLGACSSAEILAAAHPEFSPELKSSIGGALYDGDPIVTWDEFEAASLKALSVLDFPVSS